VSGTFTELRSVTFVVVTCASCAVEFGVTDRLQQARREDQSDFWCPNGHINVYRQSESDRLRKQLEAEQRRVIQANAARQHAERERLAAERSASAYKGQTTRLRKRVGNGVCPCCNRHFQNVERHMSNKHPDFADTEVTP
jgi:hypothetical protein